MGEVNIAVVGATGAVGREMVKVLEERNFPVANLVLLASQKSSGEFLKFNGKKIEVSELTKNSFKNIDFALFSAGSSISKKYATHAVTAGAVVIDNSSAFRMDNQVPLVVPEVNPQDAFKHNGIIANPNCSTIQLVVALKPVYDKAGIKRIIVSTYQSVSGTGKKAIDELMEQTKAILNKKKIKREVYPHQIAFNILPQIDEFENNAFTREEMKMIHETKKIMHDDDIKITATAARVPVLYGHSESVYLETEKIMDIKSLKQIYLKMPGIKLVDDIHNAKYPLAIMSEIYDEVMIGRLRKDLAVKNGINMWIVANNLRKGAALNAVQIAELLLGSQEK
ncbi:MAG: aspartate-semialdehyde dehydrogenase [Candidatus Cloacimonetes bacterium]|nr:aspartate-semialdehyde dehydrogenase [Candidatus Cloacimonadota bacterium]MBL7149345.1 aspartate-semialdehyde dehydrogenase [Candidatus Cloacimonadota bacterium]